MKVLKVAETTVDYDALEETGYVPHHVARASDEPQMLQQNGSEPDGWGVTEEWKEWEAGNPSDPDELHEAAGRLCYLSWGRPNPATATNEGYLKHIIDVGHHSILEHSSVTLYVAEVSRAMLLELERHRGLSFSVVSQRYVDHSDADFIVPPLLEQYLDDKLWPGTSLSVRQLLEDVEETSQSAYYDLAQFLERRGHSRKEIRGAIRAVLPENTETCFFVTGNLRTWRHVITLRNSPAADAEIRLFAQKAQEILVGYAPSSMQSLPTGEEE